MRFLFVSKIQEMTANTVKGTIEFGPREPWRYKLPSGDENVSVSVISEAIGQLVSWLSLKNTGFFGRPVFLFASKIELSEGVPVGSKVDLQAVISSESPESFVFSGQATRGEKVISRILECGGYLMPLAQLEDPEVTKARLASLESSGLPVNPEGPAFDFSSLCDRVLEHEPNARILITKTFRTTEPFYADHFPRFAVTPIVVINEMIARATGKMLSMDASWVPIAPVAVQDLKIKSFIKPGESVVVSVKKVEESGHEFETVAEILLGGKRILRGRYRYRKC